MVAGIGSFICLVPWKLSSCLPWRWTNSVLSTSYEAPSFLRSSSCLLFRVSSTAVAGTFKNSNDVIKAMSETMGGNDGRIHCNVVLVLSSYLHSPINRKHRYYACALRCWRLEGDDLPGEATKLVGGMILLTAAVNLLVGSASAKGTDWSHPSSYANGCGYLSWAISCFRLTVQAIQCLTSSLH